MTILQNSKKSALIGASIGLLIGFFITALYFIVAANPDFFPDVVVYGIGFTVGLPYTLSAWFIHSFVCTGAGCLNYAFFLSWILYAAIGAVIGKFSVKNK